MFSSASRLLRSRAAASLARSDASVAHWPAGTAPAGRYRLSVAAADGPCPARRLEDIRDSLLARIAEAEREGRTGEAEGLKVSLAAANNKLAQADTAAARRSEATDLGIPAYRDIAAATITTPGASRDH